VLLVGSLGYSNQVLGTIPQRLKSAKKLAHPVKTGGDHVYVLAGGELYFDAPLALDTDGSVYAKQDPTGQPDTSIHNPDGTPVDANAVSYFVLPCHGFQEKLGIRYGDIAAVIYKGKIEFAVFADCGPDALGEGSIALHRGLGRERIVNGKLHNAGIESGVITIVFPVSGISDDPQTPAKIRETGRRLFRELGGNLQ
jgi:hypothetical protein